jgi:hypothetical protein
MNSLSTGTKLLNNTDNAIISNANPTFVTPDGATFSIWGFIYLFETIAVIYQALPSNLTQERLVNARPYMTLAFLINSTWLVLFAYYQWWLSTLVMLAYLATLIKIYSVLDINYGVKDESKDKKSEDYNYEAATPLMKALVFTGFSMNMAWIAVASGVSVTFVLRREGWQTANGTGGSADWAIMWVVIFAAVACGLAVLRADVPYAFGTAWALAGIHRMQTVENAERFPIVDLSSSLANTANTFMIIVSIFCALAFVKAVYQGYNARNIRKSTKLAEPIADITGVNSA